MLMVGECIIMKRRTFISSAVASIAMTNGFVTAQAQVLKSAFVARPAFIKQDCLIDCWAASTSMLFATHGHFVDQNAIVMRIFGVPCKNSGDTGPIVAALNATWVDSKNNTFQSTVTAAYDFFAGVNNLSNGLMVSELSNNNPLLYCNVTHCMMVYRADYFDTPIGPNIQRVGVMDPMVGPRLLSLPEMIARSISPQGQMTFLASTQVT